VGQDGGCIAQSYRRCNDLSGRVRTVMPWGKPSRRKFKGYLVRFFEYLNASFPHASHRLNNSASDATPPQNALDCLFSHLPRRLDLVFLEFGSMARSINYRAAEALLRVLLSLQPRPVIVFLTVREWCRADLSLRFGEPQTPFRRDEKTPWTFAEETFDRWCEHYGASCLSYFRALEDDVAFYNQSGGGGRYSFRDIGYDCLHPLKGRIGTDVMTDMIVHWFQRAVAIGSSQPASEIRPVSLPPPLQPTLRWRNDVLTLVRTAASGRCYSLLDGYNSPNVYQRLHPAIWRTASCPNASASLDSCAHLGERHACHVDALAFPPPVWFYCWHALTPKGVGKKSPGLVALLPGATLDVDLDTRLGEGGTSRPDLRLLAKLQYLTSYENMGIVALRCISRCRCRPQRINGHQLAPNGYRNVSIFAYHNWYIRGAYEDCRVRLHVLGRTMSNGFKFKVRHVILQETAENVSR